MVRSDLIPVAMFAVMVGGAACSPGDPPSSIGRSCATQPCGDDAECDPATLVCVARKACGPHNCPGCCDGPVCRPGDEPAACGSEGRTCVPCAALGLSCDSARACSGACVPSCTGKCQGDDNGCGGTCTESGCAGCCQAGTCVAGTDSKACGLSGAPCLDCTAGGGQCQSGTCTGMSACDVSTCNGCCDGTTCRPGTEVDFCGAKGAACQACGTKSCVAGSCQSCTPSCSGKCAGAPDGCGGTCASNNCPGCCDSSKNCQPGTADKVCGASGTGCQDCTASGKVCSNGSCQSTCTPSCGNKCPGASNGCGGTCTTNTCSGCCSGSSCLAGNTNGACGINGEACKNCGGSPPAVVCTTAGTCQTTCVPSCSGKCAGAADGCGGTCAANNCSGCCDSSKVCQPGTTDSKCGSGGATCASCSGWGCYSQKCCNPSTCANCPEGAMCLGGNKHCCMSGQCVFNSTYCI